MSYDKIVPALVLALTCGCGNPSSNGHPVGGGPDGGGDEVDAGAHSPTAARLSVDDDDFQFDPLNAMGQSVPVDFTFTNQGMQPTGALTVSLHGNDAAAFTVVKDSCSGQVLAGGAQCQLRVAMTSVLAGPLQATLRVQGDPGGLVKVQLSGTVTPGALAVSPIKGELDVVQGQASSPITLHVSNQGAAPSGTLSLDFPPELTVDDQCSGKDLAGGEGCDVSVSLAAGFDAVAGDTRSLVYVHSPAAGDATAALLERITSAAVLQVSNVVFGAVYDSADRTATIRNIGGAASGEVQVSLADTSVLASFTISKDGCAAQTLPPLGTCDVSVHFNSGYGLTQDTLLVNAQASHGATAKVMATAVYSSSSVGTLYLQILGSGNGSVSLADGQRCISGQSCTMTYDSDSWITTTMFATPDASSAVGHWSIPTCADGSTSCSFQGNNSNQTITFVAR
jgi:hypothetical protein